MSHWKTPLTNGQNAKFCGFGSFDTRNEFEPIFEICLNKNAAKLFWFKIVVSIVFVHLRFVNVQIRMLQNCFVLKLL